MVISLNGGPQYTIVLIIGTPKIVHLILGNLISLIRSLYHPHIVPIYSL